MTIQIAKGVGYAMSTILFTIMGYIIGTQGWIPQVLQYDNVFVLFFGLFLVGYALHLKKFLHRWFAVVIATVLLYMICDWLENAALLKQMRESKPLFNGFAIVQTSKWILGIGALVTCLVVDIFKAKNGARVVRISIITMVLILAFRFLPSLF